MKTVWTTIQALTVINYRINSNIFPIILIKSNAQLYGKTLGVYKLDVYIGNFNISSNC